jgi:hypothetical protein
MKKILSIAFVLVTILNAFGNAAFAESNELAWFESMDNMQKLKSYTVQQVISGNLSGKIEEAKGGSGDFTFNVKSAIVNRDANKMDSKNIIEGRLHFALEGKDSPFKSLDANFRLSVVALADQGAYIRLENVDFNANGILEGDLQNYLDFKTEFSKAIEPIRWQWIQLPDQYIKGQLDQGAPMDLAAFDSAALKNEIIKNGFKKAVQKAVEDEIAKSETDGKMTTEDATKARTLANRFFETEFFNLKTSAKPGKENQTSFILNKGRIVEFIQRVGEEMGETLAETDLSEIRNILRKFTLTGAFRQNNEFGIFDRLKVKLILKNIEELTSLQLDYSYKIGNINTVDAISAPAKSVPLEEANLDFLPPPTNTTESEFNIEASPTNPEPLPTDGL